MLVSFDLGENNLAFSISNKKLELKNIYLYNLIRKKRQPISQSCSELTTILRKHDDEISKCDTCLIEAQYNLNMRMCKLSQHLWSYFNLLHPFIRLVMVPSRLKTQYFLGSNNLTYAQRKSWSIKKAKELLASQDEMVDRINSLEKQDDISDTILQIAAYLKIK